MTRTLLILFGLLVVTLQVDYCEISRNNEKVFIQENETRLLNLHSYVRGFDLSFETDNPSAKIYEACEVAATKSMGTKSI